MRYKLYGALMIFMLWDMALASNHGYPESVLPFTHTHETSICYGYAMARAMGKTTGDFFCPPEVTYVDNGIDTSLFKFVNDPTLKNIKVGDIVVFGQVRSGTLGHAAFVVYVPNPLVINDIRMDQVPYVGGLEQKNIFLSDVIQTQGQPVGYHLGGGHGNKVAVTFRNSFQDGILHVDKNKMGDWITVQHGTWVYFSTKPSVDLNKSGGNVEIEAIDGQTSNGYKYQFRHWEKDYHLTDLSLSNPCQITVSGSKTYTAYFVKEFNVTLQNDFGTGQIALNNVTY